MYIYIYIYIYTHIYIYIYIYFSFPLGGGALWKVALNPPALISLVFFGYFMRQVPLALNVLLRCGPLVTPLAWE